jgi:hypothetical protein
MNPNIVWRNPGLGPFTEEYPNSDTNGDQRYNATNHTSGDGTGA